MLSELYLVSELLCVCGDRERRAEASDALSQAAVHDERLLEIRLQQQLQQQLNVLLTLSIRQTQLQMLQRVKQIIQL